MWMPWMRPRFNSDVPYKFEQQTVGHGLESGVRIHE